MESNVTIEPLLCITLLMSQLDGRVPQKKITFSQKIGFSVIKFKNQDLLQKSLLDLHNLFKDKITTYTIEDIEDSGVSNTSTL